MTVNRPNNVPTDEQRAAALEAHAPRQTAEERFREVVAAAKAEEHPTLHKGDIVTVGTKTRYEIEVAMRSIVVLKQTDRERRRRLIDPDDIAKITVVEASDETRAALAEIEVERRVQSATNWMQSTVQMLRDDVTKGRKRFDDRLARDRIWDEYLLSALGELQIAIELSEVIDAELAENAENEIVEPLWETIITVAGYQLQYGRGSLNSSEPFHRARAAGLNAQWTKLLTTAIAAKAHAENDQRRRRY